MRLVQDHVAVLSQAVVEHALALVQREQFIAVLAQDGGLVARVVSWPAVDGPGGSRRYGVRK